VLNFWELSSSLLDFQSLNSGGGISVKTKQTLHKWKICCSFVLVTYTPGNPQSGVRNFNMKIEEIGGKKEIFRLGAIGPNEKPLSYISFSLFLLEGAPVFLVLCCFSGFYYFLVN